MSYIDQIRICEEKAARKQVLKELLPELEKKKTELEYTVKKREEGKRAEQKDVDRLEAGGPMNLIYSLLGQRENRLEKQKASWLPEGHITVLAM